MADLKISGRMKVKTLKKEFKNAFGSTLRVYNGVRFADEDATLASIRDENAKGGEFGIHGRTLIGNFEKKMKEFFGIKVQVADKNDKNLLPNDISLTQSGKE